MNTDGFFDSMNSTSILLLFIFFLAEVVAISLGILVVMPRLPPKQSKGESIKNIQNPLFFGAFANFEEEEYLTHIEENIICNDSARRFLAKDIYQGGIVLSEKYRKLTSAYRFALIGFISLVLTFMSVFL